MTRKYAVIGKHVSHSLSPDLHGVFAQYTTGYEYGRFDLDEDELEGMLRNTEYRGFNVTSPYKRAVIPFLDELSDLARELCAVNTILRRSDGTLYGDNTDVYGFERMIDASRVSGRKILVLGSGGACSAICKALQNMESKEIVVVSRHSRGEDGFCTYEELTNHLDANVVVNATPIGMYPESGKSPMDDAPVTFEDFTQLESVFDAIYNPYRTKILLDAERAGAYTKSGLAMLVYQGLRSAQIWGEVPENGMGTRQDTVAKNTREDRQWHRRAHKVSLHKTKTVDLGKEAMKTILQNQLNVVVVGMPGSGKSSIFRQVAICMKRPFVDADRKFREVYGMKPAEVLKNQGEEYFRNCESRILREICREKGQVIATGGGAVVKESNFDILRENSVVVYMKRPIETLSIKGRPISASAGVEELYRQRCEKYETVADLIVENNRIFGQRKDGLVNGQHKSNSFKDGHDSRWTMGSHKKSKLHGCDSEQQSYYMADIRRFAQKVRTQIVRYMDENLDY